MFVCTTIIELIVDAAFARTTGFSESQSFMTYDVSSLQTGDCFLGNYRVVGGCLFIYLFVLICLRENESLKSANGDLMGEEAVAQEALGLVVVQEGDEGHDELLELF